MSDLPGLAQPHDRGVSKVVKDLARLPGVVELLRREQLLDVHLLKHGAHDVQQDLGAFVIGDGLSFEALLQDVQHLNAQVDDDLGTPYAYMSASCTAL